MPAAAPRDFRPLMTVLALAAVVAAAVYLGAAGARSPVKAVASPARIVSLAPNVTEMLFALGAGGQVVAVTDSCNHPPEAADLPRLGAFGKPNVEQLLSLAPTLVVAADEGRADVRRVLEQAGAKSLLAKADSFQELFASLRLLGQEVGRTERAEALVAGIQAELDRLRRQNDRTPPARRPRVFVEIWGDPLTTAGAGSLLDEVISRAGGVNVAHEVPQAFPCVNPEKVVEWNPDVILVMRMNAGSAADEMASRLGWENIAAVKNRRIIDDIHPDLLLRAGPRLIEGVQALAERLQAAAKAASQANGNPVGVPASAGSLATSPGSMPGEVGP